MRFRLVLSCVVLLGALALPGIAVARKASPTAAQRLATARSQVLKVGKKSFARGRRAAVLRALGSAAKALRKRHPCVAIAALDRGRNALLTPRNWIRRRIPRAVGRTIGPGLGKAEGTLTQKNPRCARTGRRTVKPIRPRRGGGTDLKPVPFLGENDDNDQGEFPPPPPGANRPPVIGGTTGLGPDPHGGGGASAFTARLDAPPALNFFLSANVGTPPDQPEPQEPTTAVGKNVAWFTGNSDVGLSLDGGRTWTIKNPSTILPDPTGRPFCCDQLVSYSPSANLFVWLTQYWCPVGTSSPASNRCSEAGTGGNEIRVAVASPEDLRKNKDNIGAAWTYWDLPPTLFGQNANTWFDRSDMSVNASFLNWTVDVLRRKTSDQKALLARTPLSQLKARGTITISYSYDKAARTTTAQGTGTSWTYFVGNDSLSRARIWEWAPYSGTLVRHDIDHSSVPINNGQINGSDGGNWYARWGIFPGAVESVAWVKNHLIVAQGTGRDQCTDKCGSGETPKLKHIFDHPAVFTSRYDTNTWKKTGERWLWSPTLNFAWPFLAVAGDGEVGITFLTSDDNANPQPVAGFLDDEQFVYALGGGRSQGAGDYYTLRPGRTSSSFVIPVRNNEVDSDGVTRTHWRYIEYGHGHAPTSNAPSVFITSPADNRSFPLNTPITFTAGAFDFEDGVIPEYALTWREDGTVIGKGSRIVYAGTPLGSHTVSVTAVDGEGLSRTAQITIVIVPRVGPSVAITSPPDNSSFPANTGTDRLGEYRDVQFEATASDGGNGPLTYTWTDTVTQGGSTAPAVVVSSTLSPVLRLHVASSNCGRAQHDLKVSVTNGSETSTAQLRVNISSVSCIG